MTAIDFQTLNQAVDARRWARTARDPSHEGRKKTDETPTREEEQRYNQTAAIPQPSPTRDKPGAARPRSNHRLVGNQVAFVVGTFRDVHRSWQGLAPVLDHSDSPPLFGSQFHFVARTVSRVFGHRP